jgi:hypothetical protein
MPFERLDKLSISDFNQRSQTSSKSSSINLPTTNKPLMIAVTKETAGDGETFSKEPVKLT